MVGASQVVLEEAIARNSGAVLSLPSAGMLRHQRSRFLDQTHEGIWLESAPQDAPLVDTLISGSTPVGVSFKSGISKAVFTAPLLKREEAYRINSEVSVEAVLVGHPADVKVVQRRATYRVSIPADYEITMRIWRIGKDADLRDRPIAAAEVAADLMDISVGGMAVLLHSRDDKPPKVSCDERLRIELTVHDEKILIEGRVCYQSRKGSGTSARAGIQFQALQDDMEGRRTTALLTRVTGELQRLELRRHRLGVA